MSRASPGRRSPIPVTPPVISSLESFPLLSPSKVVKSVLQGKSHQFNEVHKVSASVSIAPIGSLQASSLQDQPIVGASKEINSDLDSFMANLVSGPLALKEIPPIDLVGEAQHISIPEAMSSNHDQGLNAQLPQQPSGKGQFLENPLLKPKLSYSSIVGSSELPSFAIDPLLFADGSVLGIPTEVAADVKPLWQDLIVGRFPDEAPHVGKIHVIVNKIWSYGCKDVKIDAFVINTRMVKFRIRDPVIRERVLKRGMWRIADKPMVVTLWSPILEETQPVITHMPIWVVIKNIPHSLFTRTGISFLASAAGKPKRLHQDTELCKSFDEAKVHVEVNLTSSLPKELFVRDSSGLISRIFYSYPWLPPRCLMCNKWGHARETCMVSEVSNNSVVGGEKVGSGSTIAVVAAVTDRVVAQQNDSAIGIGTLVRSGNVVVETSSQIEIDVGLATKEEIYVGNNGLSKNDGVVDTNGGPGTKDMIYVGKSDLNRIDGGAKSDGAEVVKIGFNGVEVATDGVVKTGFNGGVKTDGVEVVKTGFNDARIVTDGGVKTGLNGVNNTSILVKEGAWKENMDGSDQYTNKGSKLQLEEVISNQTAKDQEGIKGIASMAQNGDIIQNKSAGGPSKTQSQVVLPCDDTQWLAPLKSVSKVVKTHQSVALSEPTWADQMDDYQENDKEANESDHSVATTRFLRPRHINKDQNWKKQSSDQKGKKNSDQKGQENRKKQNSDRKNQSKRGRGRYK